MAKRTIRDLNISGKKILVRVDFNVPLKTDGSIDDDQRIRSALPTINFLLAHQTRIILISHLGRPTGDPDKDKKLKMDHVRERLQKLLPHTVVKKCNQVVGAEATEMAEQIKPGEILILENLRFNLGEKKSDEKFAIQLSSLAEIYINDAFGSCHRKDASMYAVALQFPSAKRAIGFLVEKEMTMLDKLLINPARPAIAVLGGAKVVDKIELIANLLLRFEQVVIGGALAYTCLKAKGIMIGASLVVDAELPAIKKIVEGALEKIQLPIDHIAENKLDPKIEIQTFNGSIPDHWMGMDIGPLTIASYGKIISDAKTIVWNGPVGKFEDERFENGTRSIANCIASSQAVTVIGGGETSDAIAKFGLTEKITFISTGGGAFLEYLKNGSLPALSVIDDLVWHP